MSETIHAAIIGIDRYPRFYPDAQLSGCVNDALAIRDFLITRVSVPKKHIRMHLSPEKPRAIADHALVSVLPANAQDIRATFAELQSVARAGVHIVIYYAGHGIRVDRRGTNERVYGFAPADTGFDADGFVNLILDRELNTLLRVLTQLGASVTVLADTCHSGSSTRAAPGQAATVRRIVVPPLSDEKWKQLVEAHPALKEPQKPDATSRGVVRGAGWFDGGDEDRAWVVLAACLDSETAKEDELDGISHGLFTACLLRELRKVPPEATKSLRWMDFFADLRRAVVSRAPTLRSGPQTPVLEGRAEKMVFDGAWTPFEPGFTVQPGSSAEEVTLEGGVIDGLDEGAEIGIYPPETTSFQAADTAGVPFLRARIVSATPARSTARLLVEGEIPVAEGSRARLIKPGPMHERLGVRLTDVPPEIVEALAKAPEVDEFVALNPTEGRIDVEVRPWSKPIPAWTEGDDAEMPAWVGTSGGWVVVPDTSMNLEPSEDDVIAYVPRPDAPGVDYGAEGVAMALGRGLVHWARYLRILRLNHVDTGLASFIEVGLCTGESAARLKPLLADPSGEYTVEEDEPLWVELRAKKKPPSRVFVAFLACSNDGNTMVQWPTQGGAPTLAELDRDEDLAEGQTLRIGEDRFEPAKPTIRRDQSSSVYTFKVIASVVPQGETPPALQGLILPRTMQEEMLQGVRRILRGSTSKKPKLAQDAWCTWDLRVRVRRK